MTREDSSVGRLLATTGVAAVNLGAITINSALAYFDTASLIDGYLSGQLQRRLMGFRKSVRNLIIDEVSMMDAEQLDRIYRATVQVNEMPLRDDRTNERIPPLGLVLVGDFCQLPPVKAKWAFEADCWPKFAAGTEILRKVWRQDERGFLTALGDARRGEGALCAATLQTEGVRFETMLETEYDGTTIIPTNAQVNRYNDMAMDRVRGPRFKVTSQRWGRQRSEWGQNRRTLEWGIPPIAEFKIGAYVMILSNAPDFEYVNGDCGHIVGWNDEDEEFDIELVRTGRVVTIGRMTRNVEQREEPETLALNREGYDAREYHDGHGGAWRGTYYTVSGNVSRRVWVLGQIEYFPVRAAWATSVHKSQGLSLDRVQIDFRHHFFKSPAMLYVALSRCRTLAGLRLVGQPDVMARHCKVDERVRGFL